ncbi:hypothetical protein [Mangrovicoccus ximenensis]|uniref:hypothetical protein n=1 Tax=Mangrovicoccus ximenensis TaxID=1911570 RepID=UPI000D3DB5F7|nr:hypothetical protein [Mangrovicoccus ximenensis]
MIEGFRRWFDPVPADLLADPTFMTALAPAIAKETPDGSNAARSAKRSTPSGHLQGRAPTS